MKELRAKSSWETNGFPNPSLADTPKQSLRGIMIQNHNDRNSRFGFWVLKIGIYLEIRILDLGFPCEARLPLLVGAWFQVYFTPLTGVLFTFPSRYSFTIGLQEYLALAVSPAGFPRAIHVSRYSGTVIREKLGFRVRDYYPLGCRFPAASANETIL